jgi:hypothetical protein
MMVDFDPSTKFYVFALRPDQGWRLANGNLRDEPHAHEFAEGLRAQGLSVRITRRDVTILADS